MLLCYLQPITLCSQQLVRESIPAVSSLSIPEPSIFLLKGVMRCPFNLLWLCELVGSLVQVCQTLGHVISKGLLHILIMYFHDESVDIPLIFYILRIQIYRMKSLHVVLERLTFSLFYRHQPHRHAYNHPVSPESY